MSIPLEQADGGEAVGGGGDAPAQQSPVCRMLRTKTAFGNYGPEATPWDEGESTTAVYWCLGTMETAGPDDLFCHPHSCRSGRTCYHPPLE